jgi:copper(I)-binding protein
MNPHRRRALLTVGALLLSNPSKAAPTSHVTVQDAWSRQTPPNASTGVVYMTLTASKDDRLTGISTPAARQAQLHRSTQTGGIMRMRPVPDGLALPAGKPVAVSPNGYHIMLEGLTSQLRPGDLIPLHLTFAQSRPVDVKATVRAFGTAPTSMPGMQMR